MRRTDRNLSLCPVIPISEKRRVVAVPGTQPTEDNKKRLIRARQEAKRGKLLTHVYDTARTHASSAFLPYMKTKKPLTRTSASINFLGAEGAPLGDFVLFRFGTLVIQKGSETIHCIGRGPPALRIRSVLAGIGRNCRFLPTPPSLAN